MCVCACPNAAFSRSTWSSEFQSSSRCNFQSCLPVAHVDENGGHGHLGPQSHWQRWGDGSWRRVRHNRANAAALRPEYVRGHARRPDEHNEGEQGSRSSESNGRTGNTSDWSAFASHRPTSGSRREALGRKNKVIEAIDGEDDH